jgi:putative hydrolase of HD superfamily
MFKRRSVAEHMWSVAKIAQGLAIWESHKFNHEVNMGLLLERAINHDLIEMTTGDIIATTKKRTKEMQSALLEIEAIAYEEELEDDIPKSWRPTFRGFILNPKDDDLEGLILSAADIIDTVLEAIEEVKLGNEPFRKILTEVTGLLVDIKLDCVAYFLKYALEDFGLDYEDYYGVKVARFVESLEFDPSVFER